MTLAVAPAPVDLRIRDAALVCIGRFGLAKTTVDDIAREAGCSRATLYRYFDGKPEIVRNVVAAEQARMTEVVVDAGRVVADADLARCADYVARLSLSLIASPGRHDLADPAEVSRLVREELLGGVLATP